MSKLNQDGVPNGYVRVAGYERIGSAGDLRIQFLWVSHLSGHQRIWVAGYFDNQDPALRTFDKGDYQNGLFALGCELIRLSIQARKQQAITYLRSVFHRT